MPTKIQQLVKLPGSKYLRINNEFAGWFGTGDRGDERTAYVVSPFGKVWPVTVGRDAKGTFLGDGWPQFVAAHGIKVGWYLVFQHVGPGMLTLKAFDDSCVIKDFGQTITVLNPAEIENAFARKPQFIVPLERSSIEKMQIPPEFLRYISEEELDRPIPKATFLTRWHINLEKDGPNVFFTGSLWPEFLDRYDMSETDVLLIKYHGCLNFSLETFGHGNNEHIEEKTSLSQQSEPSSGVQSQEEEHVSTRKRKQSNGRSMLEGSTTSQHGTKPLYELGSTGSQPWLRKEISSGSSFHLPGHFGFQEQERWKITLKPVGSDKSWGVEGVTYYRPGTKQGQGTKNSMNRLAKGWPKLKVVDSTLWEVDIERC